MTPTTVTTTASQIITQDQLPSKTYAIDWDNNQISGFIDGQEAVIQAMKKILQTDRFAHLIYSWQYGMEWNNEDLMASRVTALQTALNQALCQDARILSITNVSVEKSSRKAIHLTFTVTTIYATTTQEVTTYV
ncbi:DUF2634 domain-containing protein [Bengtsoniella intestinalis]|uniref:DUF2634 domain-containing protein n=1 Tax=Bengtsoniella intestinalis TaxID=3073143 RepID=UPI00391F3C21